MTTQTTPKETTTMVEIKKRVTELSKEYKVSQGQIQLAMKTVAKGATLDEFAMFMHIAKKSGLDPFKKEIYFYKVNSKNGGSDVVIMTSRDGFLSIAQRTGEITVFNSASVREKDEFKMSYYGNGGINIDHKILVADKVQRGKIVGAWAIVGRKTFTDPTAVFIDFGTYDKGARNWATHPDAMITKCAEAIALKKAFGISGLTSTEEMGFDPSAQEESEPENVLFNTIIKTIDAQKEPKKRAELASREIAENKVLTDEQKAKLQTYIAVEGEVVK